ncbi:IS66-like element accessory protein TnpA [Roseateles puraquae]|uniref:IS66-like element accessory protein TnpA n=1 Tax=Roseateles puraquae TaxID=431059 RepID=UPI0011863792|nr:transposase [Roseateles puraquae]MDG0857663.1 transposase [Roseateles puraquae]
MDQVAPGRRRRIHSAEFKAQAVQASQQPGVSMAAVAMAHGINANLLRRWVHERAQPPADATAVSANTAGFIALPMPAQSAPAAPSGEPIRIEVRRGSTVVAVTWPVSAADACAAWMRELLR